MTVKSLPRNFPMVFAFVGDSTMTSFMELLRRVIIGAAFDHEALQRKERERLSDLVRSEVTPLRKFVNRKRTVFFKEREHIRFRSIKCGIRAVRCPGRDTKVLQDVLGPRDDARPVAKKRMRAAILRLVWFSRNDEHVAVLLERQARRDECAGLFGGFNDDNAAREA